MAATMPFGFRLRCVWIALLAALFATAGLRTVWAQAAASSSEGPVTSQPEVRRPKPLTNETILKMSQAGLEDRLVLQAIQTTPAVFSTDPDALIQLKQAGVSQVVIAAMQAKSAGLAIHETETKVDVAPVAAGVEGVGVYYKGKDGGWTLLKTERVEFRSGGWLKSAATHGIVKQDTNGTVAGAKSSLVLPTGVELLIDAPEGTQPEEYDLLRFREKKDRREFRVKSGNVFHSETGSERDEIEFHSARIAKNMYTFTVPVDIEKGEYGVLPPGSSNVPGVSNAGKVFTFSIRE